MCTLVRLSSLSLSYRYLAASDDGKAEGHLQQKDLGEKNRAIKWAKREIYRKSGLCCRLCSLRQEYLGFKKEGKTGHGSGEKERERKARQGAWTGSAAGRQGCGLMDAPSPFQSNSLTLYLLPVRLFISRSVFLSISDCHRQQRSEWRYGAGNAGNRGVIHPQRTYSFWGPYPSSATLRGGAWVLAQSKDCRPRSAARERMLAQGRNLRIPTRARRMRTY